MLQEVSSIQLVGSYSSMEQHGVQILGSMKSEYKSVLTPEAIAFAGHIQRKFGARVLDLLQKRNERQAKYASLALGLAIGWNFPRLPLNTCLLHADLMQVKSQIFCQKQNRFEMETGRCDAIARHNALCIC